MPRSIPINFGPVKIIPSPKIVIRHHIIFIQGFVEVYIHNAIKTTQNEKSTTNYSTVITIQQLVLMYCSNPKV